MYIIDFLISSLADNIFTINIMLLVLIGLIGLPILISTHINDSYERMSTVVRNSSCQVPYDLWAFPDQ